MRRVNISPEALRRIRDSRKPAGRVEKFDSSPSTAQDYLGEDLIGNFLQTDPYIVSAFEDVMVKQGITAFRVDRLFLDEESNPFSEKTIAYRLRFIEGNLDRDLDTIINNFGYKTAYLLYSPAKQTGLQSERFESPTTPIVVPADFDDHGLLYLEAAIRFLESQESIIPISTRVYFIRDTKGDEKAFKERLKNLITLAIAVPQRAWPKF